MYKEFLNGSKKKVIIYYGVLKYKNNFFTEIIVVQKLVSFSEGCS